MDSGIGFILSELQYIRKSEDRQDRSDDSEIELLSTAPSQAAITFLQRDNHHLEARKSVI
jgi:hypothetical protein